MKKYEKHVRKYLEERDWDKLRPADLAKSISIEAAELLELFQWTNQSLAEVKKDKEKLEKIKHELADVLNFTGRYLLENKERAPDERGLIYCLFFSAFFVKV